jgi:hypothetical protein
VERLNMRRKDTIYDKVVLTNGVRYYFIIKNDVYEIYPDFYVYLGTTSHIPSHIIRSLKRVPSEDFEQIIQKIIEENEVER